MQSIISIIGDFVQRNIILIQSISGIICGLLMWRIVFYNIKLFKLNEPVKEYLDLSGKGEKFLKKRSSKVWMQIVNRINEGGQNNFKLAVAEADYILGEILKEGGYRGKDLDERLANTGAAQIPNLEKIREAHKIRNKIFSDSAFELSREEVLRIINIYKEYFEYLGFLN